MDGLRFDGQRRTKYMYRHLLERLAELPSSPMTVELGNPQPPKRVAMSPMLVSDV